MKVVSPSKVILDNITSQSIDVEATSAILSGGKKAKIKELHFRSNNESNSEDLVNGLFIDNASELEVESLSLEDALLMNTGILRIKREMNLNGGYFFNTGTISTTADPAILQNIAYLFNGEDGKINASGKLILESDVISNAGEIKANEINAIASENIHNAGTISATKSISLTSLSDIQNDGAIESEDKIDLNAKNISNSKDINSPNTNIKSEEKLQNTGAIKSKSSLDITAKDISNSGALESGNISKIKADSIQNNGRIKSKTNEIESKEIANKGTFEGEKSLNVSSPNFANESIINGNGGVVLISGDIFEHKNGEIKSAKVYFDSKGTLIKGSIAGQEVELNGTVRNQGSLQFQKGTIKGTFFNQALDGAKFEKVLELAGKEAILENSGKVTAEKITSNAEVGAIAGGEITASEIESNNYLQLESTKAENLKLVKTSTDGKLLIDSTASTPNLTKIENAGKTKLLSSIQNLSDIKNSETGILQIETYSILNKLTSLNNLQGTLEIKAILPNLTSLDLKNGAKFTALNYSYFQGLKNLTVRSGAEFSAQDSSNFSALKNIFNFGTAIFHTQLMNLDAIYNAQGGSMHLLDNAKVKGRQMSKDDILNINTGGNYSEKRTYEIVAEEVGKIQNNKKININNMINQTAITPQVSQLLEFNMNIQNKIQNYVNIALYLAGKDFTGKDFTSKRNDFIKTSNPNNSESYCGIPQEYFLLMNGKYNTLTKEQVKQEILKFLGGKDNALLVEIHDPEKESTALIQQMLNSEFDDAKKEEMLTRLAVKELYFNKYLNIEKAVWNSLFNFRIKSEGKWISQEITKKVIDNLNSINVKTLFNNIGVLNDGDIFIGNNLDITGNYKASQNAKLDFKNGANIVSGCLKFCKANLELENMSTVTAYDFVNDGIIFAHTCIKLTQNGTVTKWGIVGAENELIYDVNFTELDFCKITPIIKNKDGILKIKTNKDTTITTPNTFMEFNLDIEVPNFYVNSTFKVKNLKLKTSKFTNTGMISSRENIFVEADSFTNTSGIIQALQDMNFVVNGAFINTGVKISRQNQQTISYYSLKEVPKTVINTPADKNCGVPIKNTLPGKDINNKLAYVEPEHKTATFSTITYSANQDKMGQIKCGQNMIISAQSIDNSCSILSAEKTIKLDCKKSVSNHCGTIKSGESSTINGSIPYNGISQGGQSVNGVDPNSPIITQVPVKKPSFVKSNKTATLHSECGCASAKYNIPMIKLVDGFTLPVITGYDPKTQYTTASKSPGYIFSFGDLSLNISQEAYLGDIVSEKDIYLKGNPLIKNINSADRGKMIARGNIKAEIRNDAFNQLAMEAENIATHIVDSINFRKEDYKFTVTTIDGAVIEKVNLSKAAELAGLVFKALDFDFKSVQPLLAPQEISSGINSVELIPYSAIPYIKRQPNMAVFLPMIKRNVLRQITKVILTRITGREILSNDSLLEQLEAAGKKYARTLTSSQKVDYLALTDGNPLIVYEQSDEKDAEFETTDGEKIVAPILIPYLIYNSFSRMQQCVQNAENKLRYESDGDINVLAIEIKKHAKNVELLAPNGGVNFIGESKYDQFGVEHIEKAGVTVPGHLLVEARKDINATNAKFQIGENMTLRSKEGDINLAAIYRETHTFGRDRSIITKIEAAVTEVKVGGETSLETPNGCSNIAVKGNSFQTQDLHTEGKTANFYAPKETIALELIEKNSEYKIKKEYVPNAIVNVSGVATLDAYDNNFKGLKLKADKIVKETPGNVRLLAQKCEITEHSHKEKSNFWGHSSNEVKKNYTYYATSEFNSDKLILTGVGNLVNEGGLIKNNEQLITKKRLDKTPMGKSKVCVHNEGGGLFPPRVKADTLADALKVLKRVEGKTNLAAAGLNVVGSVSQTGTQALKVIEALQGLQNPFMVMAEIGLSRVIQGPSIGSYSNTYQRTEKIPQRPVMISKDSTIINESTHKEGIDIFDKSVFQTEKFTENYPKHTVEEKRDSKGFRLGFNAAAAVGALIFGGPAVAAFIPSISTYNASLTMRQETDIKGETVTESHSQQTQVGFNPAALLGEVSGQKVPYEFMDPRLGAIPTYQKQVNDDTVVTDSQGKVIFEDHKSSTTNPLIGEFFNCVMQVNEFSNEFNKVRAQFIKERLIEGESMEKAVEEGKALGELLEKKEVKESYEKLKESSQKLQIINEKIEKLEASEKQIPEQKISEQQGEQQLGEFLQASYKSVEMENMAKERNSVARTCLLGLTTFRESIQSWAKTHPQYAKAAEYAMDGIGYGAATAFYTSLIAGFVATAPVSVPTAVGMASFAVAKKWGKNTLIEVATQKLAEYAKSQALDEVEAQKFAETTEWIVGKVKNIAPIKKVGKVALNSKSIISDSRSLYLSAGIGITSGKWAQNKNAEKLNDVLSVLGDVK